VTPEACGSIALPGVLEVVWWLDGKVKLGIASNTRAHVLMEKTLERLGVREVFNPLVTSSGCGWRKPSPHIFRKVMDAWDTPADQVVMIGNSPTKDITGAKALGMRDIASNGSEATKSIVNLVTERAVWVRMVADKRFDPVPKRLNVVEVRRIPG